MDYKVMIDEFEGPFDLLLHLIKEDNIDIYEISIEKIVKQYLDYIKVMKDLNLTVASEYLVIASELLEIKSKMLLPKKKEEDSDDYEEDPRELLIEKLLIYQKYKEVTSTFKELEYTRKLVFTKESENIHEYLDCSNDGDMGIDDLLSAFADILKRKEDEKPISTKIVNKEKSIKERIKEIKIILGTKKKVFFEELFRAGNKSEAIVSFLSVLELVKNNEILINQEDNFKRIIISLKDVE